MYITNGAVELAVMALRKMKRKEFANAYAQALPLSVISLEAVVAWADSIILEEDEPSIEIIDLSNSKKESEAIAHLNILSIGSDEEVSIRILIGLSYEALKNGAAEYSTVAKRLYFWSMYETELEGFGELGSYWDAIDLANDGIFGDVVMIKREMLAFLNKNKA